MLEELLYRIPSGAGKTGSTSTQSSKDLSFKASHLFFNSISEEGEDLYSRAPSRPAAKSSITAEGDLV